MPAAYMEIADKIAAKIASGELRPEAKLRSTRELCEDYGVSETVIRMVMVRLKAKNLVEGRPGKGVFVVGPPTPPEA